MEVIIRSSRKSALAIGYILRTLLQSIVLVFVVSCASPDGNNKTLPSEEALDQNLISSLTNSKARTGVQGYDGISGRIIGYLLLAAEDMKQNHGRRCGNTPLNDHVFFYKEFNDFVKIQTAPRFVPDKEIYEPPVEEGYYRIDIGDFIGWAERAHSLPGCEIQYEIRKEDKDLTLTRIIS